MKKCKIFLIGVLSLLIFGLLLPQPIYANELELLNVNNNFDSMFMISFSCVAIIISVLICKNSLNEEA